MKSSTGFEYTLDINTQFESSFNSLRWSEDKWTDRRAYLTNSEILWE